MSSGNQYSAPVRRPVRFFIGFNRMLCRVEMFLATACAVAFICLTLTEIMARSFFGYSFLWAPEVSRILFVWSVFLSAAVCFRSNSHLAVDLLPMREDSLVFRVRKILILALNAVFAGVFCYFGYKLLANGFTRSTPILGLPLFYGWLAPWIMGVSSMLFILENLLAPEDIEYALTPPSAV